MTQLFPALKDRAIEIFNSGDVPVHNGLRWSGSSDLDLTGADHRIGHGDLKIPARWRCDLKITRSEMRMAGPNCWSRSSDLDLSGADLQIGYGV